VSERQLLSGVATGDDPAGTYWPAGQRHAWDFYRLKGIVGALLARWGEPSWQTIPEDDRLLHPGQSCHVYLGGKHLGRLGLLHPSVAEAWDLKKRQVWFFELEVEPLLSLPQAPLHYKPVAAFPAVERDLSVVFDEQVADEKVHRAVLAGGRPLLRTAELGDVFAGGAIPRGKRSLTLRLRFQAADRTLTDAEVDEAVSRVLEGLQGELKGQLRS
jgi:phenylalanyl-tRNA synthetase beta chain